MDSVVLVDLCAKAELQFGIAHANFQLRGSESDRDEAFVRQLALTHDCPFFSKKFQTEIYASTEKYSIQEAARNLRYAWFETMLGNEPGYFQFIMTGHHLDDNIETMLMHFFRGSGITGISGMPVKNNHIVRPLLSIPRSDIKSYAEYQSLSWVEDSSNRKEEYTRNYFRNHLIPSIQQIFPEVHKNLQNNLWRFSETKELFERAITQLKKKLLSHHGAEAHIPIELLRKQGALKTILFELLKEYHFKPAQLDEIIGLMDSTNGKYISSTSHRIIRNRKWLIIAPHQLDEISHFVIDQTESSTIYPSGSLSFQRSYVSEKDIYSALPGTAYFNAGKLVFPLILRKWKTGDYFFPLGMKKKKKISRFLIDNKLSKTAKESIWVLVSDNRIAWVVGYRMDERFRISDSTKDVLTIKNEERKPVKG